MINYEKVITFLDRLKLDTEEVHQFKQAYHNWTKTGKWKPTFKVLTSKWLTLEGVMLMTPEVPSDQGYRVFLIATTERSLRELLLTFPRKSVGMFRITEKWIEERIQDIFEGEFVQTNSGRYYRGIKRGSTGEAEQRTVSKRKDVLAAHFRKLASLKGKIEYSEFVIEGEMLVERAVVDGLPIEAILYTANYVSKYEERNFLNQLLQQNLSCYQVNDGVMGSITTTRPVPAIIANVHLNYPSFVSNSGQPNFQYSPNCTLLIAENIGNPDNLGMTLRTADAAGVTAVLLSGEGASPLHKNCIRASRGAVGASTDVSYYRYKYRDRYPHSIGMANSRCYRKRRS